MAVLELILVSVLHFEAAFGAEATHLYYTPGHEAIVPCGSVSPSVTTCSDTVWLYNRVPSQTIVVVIKNVIQMSSRFSRLSLAANCSLIVSNVTAEDVGAYVCRQGRNTGSDARVDLNVLMISPSPPDADPTRHGNVTLACSLVRYNNLACEWNSFRWLDDTRTELDGEGDGYEVRSRSSCVSLLTVRRQRGHNRRFTCQFLKKNSVKIEADYLPVFPDKAADKLVFILTGAAVGVGLLVIVAAVLIQHRQRPKATAGLQKTVHPPKETDSSLTYITVSHHNPKAPPKTKAKQEEKVTYSTIKAGPKPDAGNLYSCISASPRRKGGF